MTLLHGFISTEYFYDDVHFPRGFKRTGDFSIAEAELLTEIGKRLLMLEQGLCKPETEVEEQFVRMCDEHTEGQTKVELLWKKYKKLSLPKSFHCLNSRSVHVLNHRFVA